VILFHAKTAKFRKGAKAFILSEKSLYFWTHFAAWRVFFAVFAWNHSAN